MAESVYFAFGIHNHQPVGNFPEVFEHATQAAYLPFLEVLDDFPEIPMTFHFSGILLKWLADHHPALIERLKKMVARGQVEIQTGGFYEPILPMIPDRDKIGQIRKLTKYIQDLLGCQPTGMWLAERVWEPSLAKPIAEAGVKYIAVDDSHFKMVGFTDEQLNGYYVTEEQGFPLAIFPISEAMRYLVPFRLVEDNLQFFRVLAAKESETLVVLHDDGEKFGVWPGTHQWVYKEKWLAKFFQMLRDNKEWIKCVTFSQYMKNHSSLGPVYLPTASYHEMMQWALPPAKGRELEHLFHEEQSKPYRPFLRGGFWRVFFSKYIESNNMHKKMLYVGDKINQLPKNRQEKALDALWTGQCNCAYWHGIFGGLYLNHLRTAIYQNLLRAESLADAKLRASDPSWIETEEIDFYRDGSQCLLLSSANMNFYFDLTRGGCLFELDDKRKSFNLLNTMTRREEAYHDKLIQASKAEDQESTEEGSKSIHDLVISKEVGLANHLNYDWYRRSALIDHFIDPTTSLDEFSRSTYIEQGDFINLPYEGSGKQVQPDTVKIKLRREGSVQQGEDRYPVRVEKQITVKAGSSHFPIRYNLLNRSAHPLSVRFGVEFNFALQAGNTPDRYYIIPGQKDKPRLGSIGEDKNISQISLVEEWIGLKIVLESNPPAILWRFPIETISNSEGGFERVYQSSAVTFLYDLILNPDEPCSLDMKLSILDLKS